MSDEKKPGSVFKEEKTTQNPDKYEQITIGVKTEPSLRDRMRASMAETADEILMTSTPEPTPPTLNEEPSSSIDLSSSLSNPLWKALKTGVIGTGAAGGRIAEQLYQFGYKVCVMNTSPQDLHGVNLPAEQKLHFDHTFGGAGKDQYLGEEATREYEDDIKALLEASFGKDLRDIDSIWICTSLGGGSGAGSLVPLVEILAEYEILANIICALPLDSEGTVTKANSLNSLNKLAKLSVNKFINSLVIVDNSRIEDMYSNLSLGNFYKVANFDIANILNAFNTLSSLPSDDAIDPTDFVRILSSGNCTVFGKVEIPLYIENGMVEMSEEDLTDLMIDNLQSGILAEGFDISEAIRCGVYITGKKEYLNQIPASTFNFMFASLKDEFANADIFKGVYADERAENKLVIYTLASGLGLPKERIARLKQESDEEMAEMKEKEKSAKSKMDIFDTQSEEKQKHTRRKQQSSTFGKMTRRRNRRD